MTIVLPGDVVSMASTSAVKLGPGLLPTPNNNSNSNPSLTAIRSGALGHIDPSSTTSAAPKKKDAEQVFWIETNTNRYVPAPNDAVITQITNRSAESYTTTLFSAHSATLPALSFEGATKRHKPNLGIGALVYAKVVSADRFTDPELTCVNSVTGKADGFGQLKVTDQRGERNGHAHLFHCSIGLARSLLRPKHGLLKEVATYFPFEAAIGANGAVWVRANHVKHVIAVGKVLQAADSDITSHSSFLNPSKNGGEQMVMDDGEHVDADQVLKCRASNLDAKKIKSLVQEYL
ncbi:related to RRP40 - protein involved in ribosomal RNA processing, component of the exosome complex [Melanopsichium pennsylvanicum]|uniref:Ribosomal RNA-processing protein 40 n=1 Tax=Melanopsichium pennsylvanicum TaxID=63383 RepID=A0AAJ4XLQ1_9BASI|nr:related to RRP40 - protein involved in ribosomal RNA processing, component of the exosome complex [Melanopsichium pennsylvanicum]